MTDADAFQMQRARAGAVHGGVDEDTFADTAKKPAGKSNHVAARATATELDGMDDEENSSTATAVGLLAFAAVAFIAIAPALSSTMTTGRPGIIEPIVKPTVFAQGCAVRSSVALLCVVLVCTVCLLMHERG